jgi:uncharacterized protein
MKPCSAPVAASLLWLGFALTLHAAPLRVLYFSKSAGFEHSVVKREKNGPSYSERILAQLGAKHDLAFSFSKDGSLFTPGYFADFDVILFYTSGDLSSVGTDGHPAVSPAGKAALLEAVARGKGFVGLHSCSDTFHTHENGGATISDRNRRFKNYGDDADPFIKMLGGEFIRHGAQQAATTRVTSPQFPGFDGTGSEFNTHEEWYSLKEFAANLHVLLVLETDGMKGADYERPPFPVAWARMHGEGRVAYNAMGHREDVWDSAMFQSMLVGAINWAGKRVNAEVEPNLQSVAPDHATLPPLESSK